MEKHILNDLWWYFCCWSGFYNFCEPHTENMILSENLLFEQVMSVNAISRWETDKLTIFFTKDKIWSIKMFLHVSSATIVQEKLWIYEIWDCLFNSSESQKEHFSFFFSKNFWNTKILNVGSKSFQKINLSPIWGKIMSETCLDDVSYQIDA